MRAAVARESPHQVATPCNSSAAAAFPLAPLASSPITGATYFPASAATGARAGAELPARLGASEEPIGGGGREERRCPVFSSFSCSRLWPVCSRLYPPLWPVCSRRCFSPVMPLYVVDFIGEARESRPCWAALFPLPPAVRRQIRPVSVLGALSQNGQMPRADSPAAAFPGGQKHTPTGRPACIEPAHTTRPALPPAVLSRWTKPGTGPGWWHAQGAAGRTVGARQPGQHQEEGRPDQAARNGITSAPRRSVSR